MTDKDKKSNFDAENLTRSAYRAMSGDTQGDVTFSKAQSAAESGKARVLKKDKKYTARLPMPLPSEKIERQPYLRGAADGAALYRKYHNENIGQSSLDDPEALMLFDILEEVRCESLGARAMTGVGVNLAAALEESCIKKGYDDADTVPLVDGMYAIAFELLSRQRLGDVSRRVAHKWRLTIERVVGFGAFIPMFATMENQEAFAHAADHFLAELLGLDVDLPEITGDADGGDEVKTQTSAQADEVNDTATDETEYAGDGGGDETGDSVAQSMSSSLNPMEFFLDDDSSEPTAGGQTIEGEQSLDGDGGESAGQGKKRSNESCFDIREKNYRIYSSEFDEIDEAQQLAETGELSLLREQLDNQLRPLQSIISKMGGRLQRLLMAKRRSKWEFGLESGSLDTSRLTRIIVDPNLPATYKAEVAADFKDTVLTILIDNSGSMRGRPITIAALTTDALVRTLERAGVKVEVLGFTTVNWKGGKSRAQWTQNGRPANPGRLNDIRHIIYKPADMPFRRCRNNLGLMLKEGILKENIDGEALLWAYNRLRRRHEERRILMVISDGAPVDDSTLSANRSSYLEQDLQRVIAGIEENGDVEVTAIGIGHDVGKYYKNAVTIRDASDLPGVMMNELATLFDK